MSVDLTVGDIYGGQGYPKVLIYILLKKNTFMGNNYLLVIGSKIFFLKFEIREKKATSFFHMSVLKLMFLLVGSILKIRCESLGASNYGFVPCTWK